MRERWMIGLVAAITVIGVGGIGFAAFTTTATVNGTATGGTEELHWSGSPTVAPTGSVTGCAPSFSDYDGTGDIAMSIAATGFAPGDTCTVTETLVNGGSVGLTVATGPAAITGVTNVNSNTCQANEWTATSTVNDASSTTLAPSGTTLYTITVGLNSNAGNECQGATATFSDTLTGTSFA